MHINVHIDTTLDIKVIEFWAANHLLGSMCAGRLVGALLDEMPNRKTRSRFLRPRACYNARTKICLCFSVRAVEPINFSLVWPADLNYSLYTDYNFDNRSNKLKRLSPIPEDDGTFTLCPFRVSRSDSSESTVGHTDFTKIATVNCSPRQPFNAVKFSCSAK